MTPTESLESNELLHLALHAIERQQSREALECLKRLLLQQPDHAQALFLLGALYARIGLHDDARRQMARAVELEPDFELARFQLGWLQLNVGHTRAATETWSKLDALGSAHPLVQFKTGLMHLAHQDLPGALATLERALEAQPITPALHQDIGTVVAVLRRRIDEAGGAQEDRAAESDVPAMFLNAYTARPQ